ncbi:DUF308 domain-containing protein [Mesorhizobium sp. M0306]|uniref:HdeD family acid-resistance protein n=1 Tax=Mesorhizobium sp. M0306 TaxID=2956932 RepID=UPI0033350D41
MDDISTSTASSIVSDKPRNGRIWLATLGLALLVAGLLASASLMLATVFSIIYIAAMMIIAGLAQVGFAFTAPGWQAKILWTFGGVLYTVAGVLAFTNPLLASAGLTLLIGVLLVIGGASRIGSAALEHKGSPSWSLAAVGTVTALAGLAVLLAWPGVSLWLLGAILSVDLIFQGLSALGMAWALRQR